MTDWLHSLNLSPEQLLIIVVAAVAVLFLLPTRVVLAAAGIVGVQWLVLTRTDNLTLQLVALAVPAFMAAAAVTASLTGTGSRVARDRRGGGRR